MAGYYTAMSMIGNKVHLNRYPAIMSCYLIQNSSMQFIDTTISNMHYSCLDKTHNRIFLVQTPLDTADMLYIDVFDKQLKLLNRKQITLPKAYFWCKAQIKAQDDSVFVFCFNSDKDTILFYAGDTALNFSTVKKIYRHTNINYSYLNSFKLNDDKSFTQYYIDSCHQRNSLIIQKTYYPEFDSEYLCYPLPDSVNTVIYINHADQNILIGALRTYSCRNYPFPFKQNSITHFIAHYSSNTNFINDNNLLTFPNPASVSTTLSVPENLNKNIQIRLFSIDGRLCQVNYAIQEGHIKIDLSSLNSGLYVMLVNNDTSVFKSKLIVQR